MDETGSPWFRVCAKCGIEIDSIEWMRTHRCPECGNKGIQMRRKVCARCGVEIEDGIEWMRTHKCPECGHGIIQTREEAKAQGEEQNGGG